MTKKIVIVGTAYPFRGGLAVYNERLARAFQERGDEVSIETFTLQYPSFLFPGKSQFSDEPIPKDLNVKRSFSSVNPLSWIKLGRLISKQKPDIVIIKYWLPFMAPALGTIARLARKNKHTRVVSILDNIIPHEKRPGDLQFSKYFVGGVDGFIAMSKSVLEDLSQFNANKPRRFSPHPVYDNFGASMDREEACRLIGLDSSTKYILFFGFIRDYKGLDILLRAMAEDSMKSNDIKLIIAGEYYSNSDKYVDLINELGLNNRVIQKTDFIPDSEVSRYFCAADVVVQPYRTATQSGITQIAYHFEKPMIVTNVGGLPEIVPHNKVGFVVEPEPADIAKAIIEFYSSDKMSEFLPHIKEEKKKYSWDAMLQSIDELELEVRMKNE